MRGTVPDRAGPNENLAPVPWDAAVFPRDQDVEAVYHGEPGEPVHVEARTLSLGAPIDTARQASRRDPRKGREHRWGRRSAPESVPWSVPLRKRSRRSRPQSPHEPDPMRAGAVELATLQPIAYPDVLSTRYLE